MNVKRRGREKKRGKGRRLEENGASLRRRGDYFRSCVRQKRNVVNEDKFLKRKRKGKS